MNKEEPQIFTRWIDPTINEYKQQIQELTNNWNELEEWLKADYRELYRDAGHRHNIIREVLDKMNEIKEKNNAK